MIKKTMRHLFVMLICGYSALAYSQRNKESVVYLKNGSVIRGQVIEYIPEDHVSIKTECRNTWVFNADEIKNITLVNRHLDPDSSYTKAGFKGFYNFGFMGSNNSDLGIQLTFMMGVHYQFTPRIRAGIGSGMEFYDPGPMVPFYLACRYTFVNHRISPFLYCRSGYSVPLSQSYSYSDVDGGIMFDAGIGFRAYRSHKHNEFTFRVSYKHQQAFAIKEDSSDDITEYDFSFNRLALTIGFTF